MKINVASTRNNSNESLAGFIKAQNNHEPGFSIADNRAKSVSQRKLQEIADQVVHGRQQNLSPRALVQRRADPTLAPDITKVIEKGIANHGIYLFRDGTETAAVKFSKEDTRRAAFADKVLKAAGVRSTNSQIANMDQKAEIIRNLMEIAIRYQSSANDEEKNIGAKILSKIGLAEGARSVLIMDTAEGDEYWDILKNPTANLAFLNSSLFHKQLGRLTAADALLGNSDRVTAMQSQGASKAWFGQIKGDNFKVLANEEISTIDNDTQIPGLNLLRQAGNVTTAEDWAKFLISGGEEHIKANPLGLDTERRTADLETLFDPSKRKIIYDLLVSDAQGSNFNITTDFNTFDQNFNAGIISALVKIRKQTKELLAAAREIGGADAGAGLIDPDSLEHKARYLRERRKGVGADDAKGRMIFRIKTKQLLIFKPEFLGVPTLYAEASGKTKFVRTMTPNSKVKKKSKELKKAARNGALDASSLKNLENGLKRLDMETRDPDKEQDRSMYKALFEAKRSRLLIYLSEIDRELTALSPDEPLPGWKKKWLKKLNFRATLADSYSQGVQLWIKKLAILGNDAAINELEISVGTLAKRAEALEAG
jgi:hypothetical protein